MNPLPSGTLSVPCPTVGFLGWRDSKCCMGNFSYLLLESFQSTTMCGFLEGSLDIVVVHYLYSD